MQQPSPSSVRTITVDNTASGNPGVNLWSAILDPLAPPVRCSSDTDAEWVVVGGGFAGLAAARRLTELRPDDRIVLVEAHRISETAAGRSSGFMIDLPHDLSSDSYAGAVQADKDQTAMNRYAFGTTASTSPTCGRWPRASVPGSPCTRTVLWSRCRASTARGRCARRRARSGPKVIARHHRRTADPDPQRVPLPDLAPRRIPPDPFAFIGANVYLRWKEHQAGAEK